MNEYEFTVIEIAPDEFVFYTENDEWSTELYPIGTWSTYEEAEQVARHYGMFDAPSWDNADYEEEEPDTDDNYWR